MNYNEIIEKLKELEIEVEDLAYEDFGPKEDLGPIEEVDQTGGEDQGSEWFRILYFPDHDVYIKIEGWYSSYSGVDFNGWSSVEEVRPKQKTITVYE